MHTQPPSFPGRRAPKLSALSIIAVIAVLASVACQRGGPANAPDGTAAARATEDPSASGPVAASLAGGSPTPDSGASSGCVTTTADEIWRTGQQARMTLPFPACTQFSLAYHSLDGSDASVRIGGYTVPRGTDILSPIDGTLIIAHVPDGTLVWTIGQGNVLVVIATQGGTSVDALDHRTVPRGTRLGGAGDMLAPQKLDGGQGDVSLGYCITEWCVNPKTDVSLQDPTKTVVEWVNNEHNVSLAR